MTLKKRLLHILLAMLILSLPGAAFAATAEQMAEETLSLYQLAETTADPGEKGRLMFAISRKIKAIRAEHPKHPISAEMAFGSYRQINIQSVEKTATAWQKSNPEAARLAERQMEIQPPKGALVPNFGTPPPARSPADPAPAMPNFGNSPVASAPAFGRGVADNRVLSRTDIVERLRRAVVFIYLPQQQSSGTGFFITPNRIMTNTHVVEGAQQVVIANKIIGVRAAKVLWKGMNSKNEGVDTAVLELVGPPHDSFLHFAGNAQEGEPVAVAGYPGTPLQEDRGYIAFLALMRENRIPTIDAIPNVRFDFGTMQGVYTDQARNTENIQMGINVTNGSSGSPVVNQCGQVIGQHYEGSNAKLKVSGKTMYVNPARFSYSISFRELLKFLNATRTGHTAADAACNG